MGLINALASGVAAGANAAGEHFGKIAIAEEMARIDEEKRSRLMEAQEAMAIRGETRQWENEKARAPEKNKMTAEAARSKADADLAFREETSGRARALAEGDQRAKVATDLATLQDRVKVLRAEANAKRDPQVAAADGLKLQAARLELDEANEKAGERKQVRGLIGAAGAVDMSQPGAENARAFYDGEAVRTQKNNRLADGKDPLISDKATSADRAGKWIKLAEQELDPDKKQAYLDSAAAALSASGEKAKPGADRAGQFKVIR